MISHAANAWLPRTLWWSACLAVVVAGAAPVRALRADGQPAAVSNAPSATSAPNAPSATSAPNAPSAPDALDALDAPDASNAPSAPNSPSAPFEPSVTKRIAIVGASASDGFGVAVSNGSATPFKAELVDLRDVLLAAAKPGTTELVAHYATGMFFSDPIVRGEDEISRALAVKPTLLIGADFLFWYAYGGGGIGKSPIRSEDDRASLFELGLAQLDRVVAAGIPLVVGNLPDMRAAKGRMLAAMQLPQDATLTRLNERLADWAKDKPLVRILSLAHVLDETRSSEPVRVGSVQWDPKKQGPLMQRDRLHPAFPGLVALTERTMECAIGDAACRERFDFAPKDVKTRILDQPRK
ncbi:MAG: hypothetical protein FJ254_00225 [Phycisphaerae bacterium]|nr:hypothetical protein [Phycisphaerae bacterium]